MRNKCGECMFFNGDGKKCGGSPPAHRKANLDACANGFKGPARLFDGKKVCGGCTHFMGANKRCSSKQQRTAQSSYPACTIDYDPIQG